MYSYKRKGTNNELKQKNNSSFIIVFIIILLIGIIGIIFYKFYPSKSTEPNSENDSSTNIVKNNDELNQINKSIKIQEKKKLKNKKETKIPISQNKFDEITTFIFSQNNIYLPSNINTNEKTKIEKIKSHYQEKFKKTKTQIILKLLKKKLMITIKN